jgi:hypothetical protein
LYFQPDPADDALRFPLAPRLPLYIHPEGDSMRAFRSWILAVNLGALVLAGCASHEVVPSSGPRPATTPEQVKIYQDHPNRYEQLRLIAMEVTPEMGWDERGHADAAFDALKAQAAAAGANGLLLAANPGDFDLLVTAGYRGTFYQVPMRRNPRTAVAQAVFVLKQ